MNITIIEVMKKLVLAITFCAVCITVSAQEVDTIIIDDKKNTDLSVIGFNVDKEDGDFSMNLRLGLLDIGMSSYLYDGGLNNLPQDLDNFEQRLGKSININWHPFRQRLGLDKKKLINLEYGLTFSFMNYHFANDFRMIPNEPTLMLDEDGIQYSKNKLKSTFLQVPIMLTFVSRDRRKHKFHLSAGGYAGVLIASKQKLKSDEFGKEKIKDDFNMNKFRYGLEGRIGIGPINFYAQYSLVSLFKDDQGPELYPLNIGVTLLAY